MNSELLKAATAEIVRIKYGVGLNEAKRLLDVQPDFYEQQYASAVLQVAISACADTVRQFKGEFEPEADNSYYHVLASAEHKIRALLDE